MVDLVKYKPYFSYVLLLGPAERSSLEHKKIIFHLNYVLKKNYRRTKLPLWSRNKAISKFRYYNDEIKIVWGRNYENLISYKHKSI